MMERYVCRRSGCGGYLGNSFLHYAAQGGNVEMIEYLLNMEEDPNAKNYLSETPLHLAADRNQIDAARLLIDVGAPVDAENKNGMTALMISANRGNLDIVQALLAKRATVVSGPCRSKAPAQNTAADDHH